MRVGAGSTASRWPRHRAGLLSLLRRPPHGRSRSVLQGGPARAVPFPACAARSVRPLCNTCATSRSSAATLPINGARNGLTTTPIRVVLSVRPFRLVLREKVGPLRAPLSTWRRRGFRLPGGAAMVDRSSLAPRCGALRQPLSRLGQAVNRATCLTHRAFTLVPLIAKHPLLVRHRALAAQAAAIEILAGLLAFATMLADKRYQARIFAPHFRPRFKRGSMEKYGEPWKARNEKPRSLGL